MAHHVEPATAAARMVPALVVDALGIGAHEDIVAPFGVRELLWLQRPCDVGLAAVRELGLLARTAVGAGDQQHAVALPWFMVSARPRRRRARRSGSRG